MDGQQEIATDAQITTRATEVPQAQPSIMNKWDALDEESAKLKTEADQKLFGIITNAHDWILKQNLPWLVPDGQGKYSAVSPANIYHFKSMNNEGKKVFSEVENKQTYVTQDQTSNSPQQLWENDLRVRSFNSDPQTGGTLLDTIRFHYRLDGLESIDALLDSLGSIEYYPPDARDFDYNSEHDGYTVADIVYDQDDNMVDMVRARQTDVSQRKDPFMETEKTLHMLASSHLLGRFDPYTKQRLAGENS